MSDVLEPGLIAHQCADFDTGSDVGPERRPDYRADFELVRLIELLAVDNKLPVDLVKHKEIALNRDMLVEPVLEARRDQDQ